MAKLQVNYVTSSDHKIEENDIFVAKDALSDGARIVDLFDVRIRRTAVPETLEVDLSAMVIAEASLAYQQLKVPCIVEHAGLIFDEYRDKKYPGGLTKPMWNALGEKFIEETRSAGRAVTAHAVIAYCDGQVVRTFEGDTHGKLAPKARGSRKFYWDTVFVPDNPESGDLTYAEIIDDSRFGLEYKVLKLSQSTKAKRAFLEFLRKEGLPQLWRIA
jgi:XTP/dITP diphosphohydrolase